MDTTTGLVWVGYSLFSARKARKADSLTHGPSLPSALNQTDCLLSGPAASPFTAARMRLKDLVEDPAESVRRLDRHRR